MTALNPKDSGEFIVKNAKYLQVHELGIKNLSNQIVQAILDGSLAIENFSQHEFHPKKSDENAFNWIFVLDTLNFCFWSYGDNKWNVDGQTGYFALCASIKRALNSSIDITDPKFYATMTLEQLAKVFESDNPNTKVPLLQERLSCLHEVGKKLLEKYDGDFKNVVIAANGSAKKLLETIIEEFPCFRDAAVYNGKAVTIYKRAQILIGDVYAFTRGEGLGDFKDLNESITMFADYRVPQVLVHFGALTYNEELMNDLKQDKLLENGEPKEVEIRGASIYIVEVAKEQVLQKLAENFPQIPTKHVNSVLIDHFLWDYRRANADLLNYIPFHKTMSIYY